MSTVVFDLEARVDPSLWQAPADDPEAFAPIPAWTITTLGYAEIDNVEDGIGVRFDAVQGSEESILHTFRSLLSTSPTLVTWNGRGFDLPLIVNRAMVHGVPLPRLFTGKYESDYQNRYQGPHVDLQDRCSLFGSARRFSQDIAARPLGLPGKHVGNGGDVADMTPAEEAAYCLDDVAQLAWIYLAWRRVKDGCRVGAAFDALARAINNEPRLAPLAAHLATMERLEAAE